MRTFEDAPARRERVPLLVGIYGPSGSGKTYSALRLAEGMRRVAGGEIFVIDTEARRALHYADRFAFRHVDFRAPFSPDDYRAALAHCIDKGARVLVIDNMSHEHEGQGGVLEWQQAEEERLATAWKSTRDKVKISAWQEPKRARMRLINAIIQAGVNAVFCFRAKEKIRPVPGRSPEARGWQPVGGEEFIFEMTTTALLMPGSNGIPEWNPPHDDEKAMLKRPAQFRELYERHAGQAFSEDMGEAMARWADGDTGTTAKALLDAIEAATTMVELDGARAKVGEAQREKKISRADIARLAEARDRRVRELTGTAPPAA